MQPQLIKEMSETFTVEFIKEEPETVDLLKDELDERENNFNNDEEVIERDDQSLQLLKELTTYVSHRNRKDPIKCPYCPRIYKRMGDLKRHYTLGHCRHPDAKRIHLDILDANGEARAVPTEQRIRLRNITSHTEIAESSNRGLDKSQQPNDHSKLEHYDMYLFWDKIIADMPKECLNQVRFRVTALLCDIQKEQQAARKD